MRPEDEARIAELVRVLAKVASGDFSEKPDIVEADDEVSKFALAVRFMIDDLQAGREQEAAQRAELEAANASLRELSEMKTRFINTAAHELNTPLTPIRLQLHLLRRGMLGPLSPKQEAAVEVVGRNLERLSALVADVLDAARLQSEHLRLVLKPTDVRALAAEAVQTLASQADAAGVALSVEGTPTPIVAADARRVSQVLLNLLTNALKFTPRGGSIRVDARVADGCVRVSVRDTGAGLTAEQRERLFHPFSQVHDPLRHDVGGTGLGLFVSRGIVEQHGGHMWCESEGPGKGALFGFTIPLAAPATPPADAAPVGFPGVPTLT